MSLTGHIDVFPLEEVLRLLARSYKSGCLRVDAPDVHGRVFINGGSVTFATVGTDDELRRQLLSSKVVNEDTLRNAEVGGRSLGDSENTTDVAEFFREEVIESLYRIRKPGRGQFVFNVDVTPRYKADQPFDVEMCISEADRRAMEWADIESVLPTVDDNLRVAASAPNNEPVTLAPNTWRLVANFEGSSTVRTLADRLGLSRFRVAKDLAGMVRAGLVEPARGAEPVSAPAQAPTPEFSYSGYQTAAAVTESEPYEAPPDYEQEAQVDEVEAAAEANDVGEPELKEADFNRSWWADAVEETETDEGSTEPPTEAPEGSDTFLDRVFSQLNENPEGQGGASPVTNHGFLKRRRMSSVGLDE